MRAVLVYIISLVLAGVAASALGRQSESDPGYDPRIRELLAAHCHECHGETKQKGSLRLDSPGAILRGGGSGEPVMIPGESSASYIIRRVTSADPDERMPPDGPRLSGAEILTLRRWIDAGASMPGAGAPPEPTTTHWSFQSPVPVSVPESDQQWSSHPIDAFIERRLRADGLRPSERADRRTLIRRVRLVMHGLPPTPAEVERFIHDDDPGAYSSLVEDTLASPRYGERWGRHWLDVVRFAETTGFETNRERPTAYHYRDYVIRSFNEDKPYDRFVMEQIAGDALGADAGTGFLVAGPNDIVKSPDENLTKMQRQDELADIVNATGTAFMGLTTGCARCHNHKFDPITQRDYYAWSAVFAGVEHGERTLPTPGDRARLAEIDRLGELVAVIDQRLAGLRRRAEDALRREVGALRPAVDPVSNSEDFDPVLADRIRFSIRATNNGIEPCIDELEVFDASGRNAALAANGGVAEASGTYPGSAIHRLEHINDGEHGNSRSWISDSNGEGWVQIRFSEPTEILRVVWGRDREGRYADRLATEYEIEAGLNGSWRTLASSADRAFREDPESTRFLAHLGETDAAKSVALLAQRATISETIAALKADQTLAWLGTFRAPGPTYRLYRGDHNEPREAVAPDALSVTGTLGMAIDEPEQQRRMKLAGWLASDRNPLTARVIVNRIWQHLFGTGLVATPNDFGGNGAPPSHPELLDWLALELIQSGWSIKHIQRLILTSETFRQSSAPRADAGRIDRNARLLWRFPPRRLEAEAIRDGILYVAGSLDERMGGPGFSGFEVQAENVRHYFPKTEFGAADWRRMVYMTKVRQEQDAVFGAFDCPDGNQVTPTRSRSTTPLQALNLFNSTFVNQQADMLATRLRREVGEQPAAQVGLAYSLFYGRSPTEEERADAVALVVEHGLPSLCRALFNTNEFLFIF